MTVFFVDVSIEDPDEGCIKTEEMDLLPSPVSIVTYGGATYVVLGCRLELSDTAAPRAHVNLRRADG